jgi:hypothetical protein
MWEQDAGRKASRKFATSSALEMSRSHTNDPQQGARLVRAFLLIRPKTLSCRGDCGTVKLGRYFHTHDFEEHPNAPTVVQTDSG